MKPRARWTLATLIASSIGAGVAGPASAAVFAITDARITGGALIVTGTTPGGGQSVSMFARYFVASNAAGVFSFTVRDYLRDTCVADVAMGAVHRLGVIANCGRRALTNYGAWSAGRQYLPNDVVSFHGSAWRSISTTQGLAPDTNPARWQLLASKGAVGVRGPAGPTGPTGPQGGIGPAGAAGPAGPLGDIGPTGPTGGSGMATASFNGTGPAVTGNDFVFLGPTATISIGLGGGQRVMAAASTEATGDAAGNIGVDMCSRPSGTTDALTILNGGAWIFTGVDTTPSVISAVTSDLIGPGTYDIGLCAGAGQITVTYGRVIGWVQVLN